jgi:hypothetical protein
VECKEWLEKFPHLRILGTQVPNWQREDDFNLRGSFQANAYNSNPFKISLNNLSGALVNSSLFSPLTNQNAANNNHHTVDQTSITTSKAQVAAEAATDLTPPKYFKKRENTELNYQGLYLNGSCLPVNTLGEKELNQNHDKYSFLEEEIFAEEGVYEELLAYDNQEEEYLFEHNKRLNLSKRRRHGLPPITPKAAMKDLVLNFLFDHMWSEMIDWSMDLIKVYAKTVADKGAKHFFFKP